MSSRGSDHIFDSTKWLISAFQEGGESEYIVEELRVQGIQAFLKFFHSELMKLNIQTSLKIKYKDIQYFSVEFLQNAIGVCADNIMVGPVSAYLRIGKSSPGDPVRELQMICIACIGLILEKLQGIPKNTDPCYSVLDKLFRIACAPSNQISDCSIPEIGLNYYHPSFPIRLDPQ